MKQAQQFDMALAAEIRASVVQYGHDMRASKSAMKGQVARSRELLAASRHILAKADAVMRSGWMPRKGGARRAAALCRREAAKCRRYKRRAPNSDLSATR
jgi:hypothetical protein